METNGIDAQLELEQKMVQRGVDRFVQEERKAEDGGHGADTTYARKMIHQTIRVVIDGTADLLAKKTPGRPNRAQVLLQECKPEAAAYITLQVLFNSFTFDAQLAATAVKIGQRIEDEIRFSRFGEMHGDYYRAIQDDFKRKVDNWFDEVMDRTGGWYKRHMQIVTLSVGFGIAAFFNADTFFHN